MIDAAMEGDVETLAGLASQDTAMLHARLPLSNSSTNSGALANEFTGDATATALWLAACKGHAEAVRWLLTRGADGSTSYHCTSHTGAYSSGCTALHAACIKGHSAVVRVGLRSTRQPEQPGRGRADSRALCCRAWAHGMPASDPP